MFHDFVPYAPDDIFFLEFKYVHIIKYLYIRDTQPYYVGSPVLLLVPWLKLHMNETPDMLKSPYI